MAYFTVPPSNPVLLGAATSPGPLPISPPLGFNLAAVKTASTESGTADCRKTAPAKIWPRQWKTNQWDKPNLVDASQNIYKNISP